MFKYTAININSALPNFDKNQIFDRIQLSNIGKHVSSSRSAISKDKIKIKERA